MNKTDQSLHKICIAAIKRHTMLDYMHEFKYSSFYANAQQFVEEVAPKLNLTLHNGELSICSVIVDDQNWSVLTTQRIITCIESERQEGNIQEANYRRLGNLKDRLTTTYFGHIVFDKNKDLPFFIENGKPSTLMVYGVQTLIQILPKS